jgi:hypothetical protein
MRPLYAVEKVGILTSLLVRVKSRILDFVPLKIIKSSSVPERAPWWLRTEDLDSQKSRSYSLRPIRASCSRHKRCSLHPSFHDLNGHPYIVDENSSDQRKKDQTKLGSNLDDCHVDSCLG